MDPKMVWPYIVEDPLPYQVGRIEGRLPETFPPGTEFADVEGVPVASIPLPDGGLKISAFDPEERGFSISSFLRNGTLITEADFRSRVALIAARQAAT
jgi:hypothetical protein